MCSTVTGYAPATTGGTMVWTWAESTVASEAAKASSAMEHSFVDFIVYLIR